MNDTLLTPLEELKGQKTQFQKELINVTDGVYAAVGYDGSNTAMIVGDEGLIIIDTLRALSAAKTAAEDFFSIADKPVQAIIYTHSHGDHTGGATAFAKRGQPEIYARANFTFDMDKGSPLSSIMMKRNIRQFGRDLPDKDLVNRGVAAARTPPGPLREGFLPPTRTFSEKRLEIVVSGVTLHLVAAPGETDDQLYVWAPEKGVLFCGDNHYHAFPNLYAIRGTQYRDVRKWSTSVAEMSELGAEFLVPGHTRPVFGKQEVKERLSNYSKAISHVYDETVKGMNQGLSADELAHAIHLPPELAEQPYLKEFYGAIPWAVRMIFSGNLGWFDGNPSNLFPLGPKEEAKQMAELAGGEERLMAALREALNSDNFQWGCQLADHIIALAGSFAEEAQRLKVDCLRALAGNQINAPAYNYYMSMANEMAAE